jgi:competence protein ComEC
MATDDEFGARARALAAELGAARRRATTLWPNAAGAAERFGAYLRSLAALEITPGRLMPWLPVAFGFGVVLYFTADREPALWAPCALALASIAIAYAARHRGLGFPLALGFAAIAIGFAVATARTAFIAHPVLQSPAKAEISGFVEIREERAKTDRIVVRVHKIDGTLDAKPERVRLAVRKGTAPAVGEFVSLKANLSPPLQPLRPGGYDFARDMYFQKLGASGYALGRIKVEPPPIEARLALRIAAMIDTIRETIDDRIRDILPGDRGSIASALITG